MGGLWLRLSLRKCPSHAEQAGAVPAYRQTTPNQRCSRSDDTTTPQHLSSSGSTPTGSTLTGSMPHPSQHACPLLSLACACSANPPTEGTTSLSASSRHGPDGQKEQRPLPIPLSPVSVFQIGMAPRQQNEIQSSGIHPCNKLQARARSQSPVLPWQARPPQEPAPDHKIAPSSGIRCA